MTDISAQTITTENMNFTAGPTSTSIIGGQIVCTNFLNANQTALGTSFDTNPITGVSRLNNLTTSALTTGDLNVLGDITASSDVNVAGKCVCTGNLKTKANLNVDGNANITGTVSCLNIVYVPPDLSFPNGRTQFAGTIETASSSVIDMSFTGKINNLVTPSELATLSGISGGDIQTQLNTKAMIDSPTFTGTPVVPTALSTTNDGTIASCQFIKNEIANLIGGAPTTLDTLSEIANSLAQDANLSTTLTNLIGTKVATTIFDTKMTALDNSISSNTNGISGRVLQTAYDTKISALDSKNTTQDTSIANNVTSIGTKVSQSDYDTKMSQIQTTNNNQDSAITNNANSISAINAVDNLQQQAIDNRLPLSGGTVTGNFASQSTLHILEKVIAVAVASNNTVTCNYATGGVFYVTGLTSATNVEVLMQGFNPSSSTTTTSIVTLLIDTSAFEAYGATCKVNGTTRSVIFAGGASSVDIAGATMVQQTFSVIYSGSSGVPVAVMSSVVPFMA